VQCVWLGCGGNPGIFRGRVGVILGGLPRRVRLIRRWGFEEEEVPVRREDFVRVKFGSICSPNTKSIDLR